MSRLAIMAAGTIALFAATGSANAASFNCNAHLSYTERAICDNPGLSRADDQMASLYFSIVNNAGPGFRHAIERRQLVWLGQRNGCGANVHCLWDAYHSRIQFLSQVGGN
jgi:uncharacterized protein